MLSVSFDLCDLPGARYSDTLLRPAGVFYKLVVACLRARGTTVTVFEHEVVFAPSMMHDLVRFKLRAWPGSYHSVLQSHETQLQPSR
jgi:hypothetical protein